MQHPLSEADNLLAHQIAGEQEDTESEYERAGANFGTAHQYAPIAGLIAG